MQVEIGGAKVRVGGIAKGSGMIHPNMATMLSVITSDAAVEESLWQDIVRRGAINSFNQVSAAKSLLIPHRCCIATAPYTRRLQPEAQAEFPGSNSVPTVPRSGSAHRCKPPTRLLCLSSCFG